jgi:hypothetical protein
MGSKASIKLCVKNKYVDLVEVKDHLTLIRTASIKL